MRNFSASRLACATLLLAAGLSGRSFAGVSYATAGSTYTQNFDTLPKDAPQNANIETAYLNGWMDDTVTVAGDHISLPGWYLFHPTMQTEGGFSGNQRLRFGPGANTGSFWVFGTSASADDMALGSVGSNTVTPNNANMYIALRLINDTGSTLGSFTITYDGEQWRDGASPAAETLLFEYSLTALLADWNSTAAFVPVPELNFSSPSFAGTSSGGSQVDGGLEGLLAGIHATVNGISWAPGTELWFRWADRQIVTETGGGLADDGLAIDNFSFTASLAPPAIPDANLHFRKEGAQLLLEWQGASAYTYQVQHSTELQTWSTQGDPVQETTGTMTWPIPPDLLDDGRHFFRLFRTAGP